MNGIGVAAIGCGYWGPNVIRNLAEMPGFVLRQVCDSNPDRLAAVARRYPTARPVIEFEEALRDQLVDAVYVATPVSTHYALVKRALLAHKHVLVEKPLATTVEQAEELAELARTRQLTLMVGHTFVFSPPVRTVKQLIDAGSIGPIYYIETTRVNLGLFQKDVSVVWDLAPHDLSILLYWLGEVPTNVSARGRSFHGDGGDPREDVAFLTVDFPSGVLAQIQVSWLAPSKLRRTSIVGRQRMVVYDDLEPVEKVKVYDRGVERQPDSFGEFQLTYRSGAILSPALETTEPLKNEVAHFLECITTGREPDTGPRGATDIIRVIQAAERSLRLGGGPQPVQPSGAPVAVPA